MNRITKAYEFRIIILKWSFSRQDYIFKLSAPRRTGYSNLRERKGCGENDTFQKALRFRLCRKRQAKNQTIRRKQGQKKPVWRDRQGPEDWSESDRQDSKDLCQRMAKAGPMIGRKPWNLRKGVITLITFKEQRITLLFVFENEWTLGVICHH